MVAMRLVLLLILSMSLEVASPLGPDVMESLGGSQEAARASAHPRLRLDRDVHAPAKGDPDRTTAAYQPSAVGNQQNRPLTGGWVRKLPPAASDSASSPEDH
jgi:hypothetical protein